ncbi:DUF4253 domain-containing protein [Sphingosinicella terrae]|uniref:DUF4253 domain-containing protein n=1 Tax=Sphingosinicella terrae TaxID=2172047 RepID=UPI002547195E|nr:DUF4253 domain-containing protein [Sphingosinicella terrae]
MSDAKADWLQRLLSQFGSGIEGESWRDRMPGDPLSEGDRMLVEALPFERLQVRGEDAMSTWSRLRTDGGGYPLLVGDDEGLIRLAEQWSQDERTVAEMLETAAGLEVPRCFSERRRYELERLCAVLGDPVPDLEEELEAPLGQWPEPEDVAPNDGPCLAWRATDREPLPRANFLRLPARDGAEIPALFHWGGWNECLPSEYHVAALKSWRARFGAELVAMNGDTIELRVARRPTTRDEALALAREFFVYCPDVVLQGAGDLSTLAAILMISDWWYFWWD